MYANNSSKKETIQHIIGSNWSIIASIIDWEIYYHHKNYRWSTVSLTDEKWKSVKNFEYDPYGKPINFISWNIFELLRRFTSHIFDMDIWLYYAKARYYDPKNHRFLTADPKREFDNTYSYVWNDPVNYVDLSWMGIYFLTIPNINAYYIEKSFISPKIKEFSRFNN